MHPADVSVREKRAGLCALSHLLFSKVEALRCVSAATVYILAHLLSVQSSSNCCRPYPYATTQYLIADCKFRSFAFIAGKQLK